MRPEDLEQLRFNVLTNVSRMPGLIMYRNYNFADYEADLNHLQDLEEVLNQLDTVFNMGPEVAAKALGGEFASQEISTDRILGIPLYLYLDVITACVTYSMASTTSLAERKNQLLGRVRVLRDKAANLPHNPHFHPKKHLSKSAIEGIVRSKGNFIFSTMKADGKNYVSVKSTVTFERYEVRNGDIYNPQATHYTYEDFAFEEDYKRVKMRESERYINHIKEIQNAIKKYFKNGVIPDSTNSFHSTLLDHNMDSTVRSYLFAIVEKLSQESLSDEGLTLEELFKELKEQEAIVLKKQAEEKAKAFAQQTISEDNGPKKRGVFERFRGVLRPQKQVPDTQEDIDRFEEERKKQIIADEEVRNVVMYQRQMVRGKEVLVPMSNDEYKVVKR